MSANPTAQSALEDVQSTVSPSAAKLDQAVDELKERASRVAHDTLQSLRTHATPYMDDAGERLQTAQRYVVERVQKQPLTTTLAALGVGLLIGLIIGGGRSR